MHKGIRLFNVRGFTLHY